MCTAVYIVYIVSSNNVPRPVECLSNITQGKMLIVLKTAQHSQWKSVLDAMCNV